ncbi:MAG: MipA/OmpV family protein [Pseudomonadota bacterium]
MRKCNFFDYKIAQINDVTFTDIPFFITENSKVSSDSGTSFVRLSSNSVQQSRPAVVTSKALYYSKRFLLFTTFVMHAQSSLLAEPSAGEPYDNLTDESPWHLGLAVGYGERTNPLIASDDIDLYWMVDIAYFGDHFFFDNGDLGVYLYESQSLSFNLLLTYTNEREYYENLSSQRLGLDLSRDNADDVISEPPPTEGVANDDSVDDSSDGGGSGEPQPLDPAPVDQDEVPDLVEQEVVIPNRDYAIQSGIEILVDSRLGEWQLQWLKDISNTHGGHEIWGAYSLPLHWGKWQAYPSLGFTWKSEDFVNYYYGIDEQEATATLTQYQGKNTFSPQARWSIRYHLNQHWSVGGVFSYEALGDGIKNSPLVFANEVKTYFIGVKFQL